jgi:acetyl/propionyl-CoA carboxylase alpha subunit
MLQVNTGSSQVWEVEYQPDAISVNGESFTWDLAPLGNGRYHILHEGRSFSAEVVSVERAAKTIQLKLDGRIITINAKDRFDLLLEKLGMSDVAAHKINELKAPMRGLIVDFRVAPGQTVQNGDPLLVLEAMKMENILKSPGDGVVSAIKVSLRDNVTKGQVLIQFS